MELKPNGQRAKAAIVFIWVILALGITSMISQYFQYRLTSDVLSGKELTVKMARAADFRQNLINAVYTVAYIISAVMFLRWFRRAFSNLESKVWPLNHTDSDAVAWWFVPVANLFKPYQIMKEMYVQTEMVLEKNVENHQPQKTFYTLGWWWALWILHIIAGYWAGIYLYFHPQNISAGIVYSMIGCVIGISAALVAVLVVQDYSEKESMLFGLSSWKEDDFTASPEALGES